MSKAPPVDVSVHWPRCTGCPYRHAPDAACPRGGVWMVYGTCLACRRVRAYCRRHDALWAFKGRVVDGRVVS